MGNHQSQITKGGRGWAVGVGVEGEVGWRLAVVGEAGGAVSGR